MFASFQFFFPFYDCGNKKKIKIKSNDDDGNMIKFWIAESSKRERFYQGAAKKAIKCQNLNDECNRIFCLSVLASMSSQSEPRHNSRGISFLVLRK